MARTAAKRTAPLRRRAPPAPRRRSVPRRGPSRLATVLCAGGVALLTALGVWQLQRLQWKTALLQRLAALQTAPAEPLSVVLNRLADGRPVNFSRVAARCDGLGAREVALYGLRTDGPGWRMVTACRLPADAPYGSVLVDMGFSRRAGLQPPRPEPVTLTAGDAITGVLRLPDPQPWFASLVAPPTSRRGASGEFYGRDVPAMAAALGAARPAPVMLLLERPAAGPGLIPSALPTGIENRHLEYALTWFGLAAALVGVWVAAVVSGRRAQPPGRGGR